MWSSFVASTKQGVLILEMSMGVPSSGSEMTGLAEAVFDVDLLKVPQQHRCRQPRQSEFQNRRSKAGGFFPIR